MTGRTRKLAGAFSLLAFLLIGQAAHAVSVSLTPTSATVPVSGLLEVAVQVHGLGSSAAPTLGSFDLDVAFDDTILGYSGASFDLFLGVSLQDSGELDGIVDLAETSFSSVAALDALQPDSFTLGTLSFVALAPGSVDLVLSQTLLGDALGVLLAVDAPSTLSMTVTPEPGTLPLVALGLLLIARRRR